MRRTITKKEKKKKNNTQALEVVTPRLYLYLTRKKAIIKVANK